MNSNSIVVADIESKIYLIRGEKVMLDHDLAELYRVPTMRLNEQVKRNGKRFPDDFMFRLSNQEFAILKSHFAISSSKWGGRRVPPRAFTEQGVAMLSTVLNSEQAINVNVAIMRAFVRLRKVLSSNRELEKKIAELESKYDGQFKVVFEAMRRMTWHSGRRPSALPSLRRDSWLWTNRREDRCPARHALSALKLIPAA